MQCEARSIYMQCAAARPDIRRLPPSVYQGQRTKADKNNARSRSVASCYRPFDSAALSPPSCAAAMPSNFLRNLACGQHMSRASAISVA